MNNTILSHESQEKSVFLFGNKEIYLKLIKSGIAKGDISTDGTEAIYVRPEHFAQVEKMCLPLDIFPQLIDIPFDSIKKSDTLEYLKAKKSALMLHHGDQIVEHASLTKAIDALDEKALNDLEHEPLENIVDRYIERNTQTRTQDILGLDVPFIESIRTHMFGLRGLIALVAAPNCGKTVLVAQCITDALKNNPDCCAVFISLEMKKESIIERMIRAEAGLTFKEMNLKSPIDRSEEIAQAAQRIKSYGNRLVILGKEECEKIDSHQVIRLVNKVKEASGCSRSILVIDYLQIWPINYDEIKTKSDLEADKWHMAQMQILQKIYIDDPAIIICEARKSASGVVNRLTLGDISGSARLGFGFEAALSINPYSDDEQLFQLGKKLLHLKATDLPRKSNNGEILIRIMREVLYGYGYAFSDLEMLKIREGDRFIELMTLDFRRNIFFSSKTKNDERLASLVRDLHSKFDVEKETDEEKTTKKQ